MDVAELRRMRRNLDTFLGKFADCIKTEPSRGHLRTYVRGQVGDLERKSVEPIALAAGVAPRTLQEFLGLHRWDHQALRRRVGEIVRDEQGDPDAILVIDETGCPKKGDKTAGVQRQYCGATGKVDNCVVTVNLGYATPAFHTLIDSDLYVPQESWHEDRERCREAGIPDEVVYRPKWQIGLDLLKEAQKLGLPCKYLTADEDYGDSTEFRCGVAALGLTYVVEVSRSTTGWLEKPCIIAPKEGEDKARARKDARREPGAPRQRRVDALWKCGGPPWQAYHIKETEKGPVVWEAWVVRFFPAQEDLTAPACWLLVARNVLDAEVKYFLSNAPEDTDPRLLLHVGFSRCHIERMYQDAKMQVGFDHFEVRHYLPLMRHLILSMVSLLFLARETQRLREKKSMVERPPGAVGRGGATRSGDVITRADATAQESGSEDRIPPEQPPTRGALAHKRTTATTAISGHRPLRTPQVFQCFVAL